MRRRIRGRRRRAPGRWPWPSSSHGATTSADSSTATAPPRSSCRSTSPCRLLPGRQVVAASTPRRERHHQPFAAAVVVHAGIRTIHRRQPHVEAFSDESVSARSEAACPITARAAAGSADALEHTLDAVRNAIDYENRPEYKRSWLLMSSSRLWSGASWQIISSPIRAGSGQSTTRTSASGSFATAPIRTSSKVLWCVAFTTWYSVTRMPIPTGRRSRPASCFSSSAWFSSHYKGAIFWKMTAGMGDI